jgi:hypothetical protein
MLRDPDPSLRRGWGIFFISSGALSVALGVLAVAAEATVSGPCPLPSECATAYGSGAASVGGGALEIGLGIYLISSRAPRWVTALVPVPLVIPTSHGSAVGLGFAGQRF